MQGRVRPIAARRPRCGQRADIDDDAFRRVERDVLPEQARDLVRILLRHEPDVELRARPRGQLALG